MVAKKNSHLPNKTHMFYFLSGSGKVSEMHLRNKTIGWYRRCISETSTDTRYDFLDPYLSTNSINIGSRFLFHTNRKRRKRTIFCMS